MSQQKEKKKLSRVRTKLSNYKVFHRKCVSNGNEKNRDTYEPVHLGLSIPELSKIIMHEFWYDYIKPKYGENAELYYMDTDSFIVYVKTCDIYKSIAEDVSFDTSNYELS